MVYFNYLDLCVCVCWFRFAICGKLLTFLIHTSQNKTAGHRSARSQRRWYKDNQITRKKRNIRIVIIIVLIWLYRRICSMNCTFFRGASCTMPKNTNTHIRKCKCIVNVFVCLRTLCSMFNTHDRLTT